MQNTKACKNIVLIIKIVRVRVGTLVTCSRRTAHMRSVYGAGSGSLRNWGGEEKQLVAKVTTEECVLIVKMT